MKPRVKKPSTKGLPKTKFDLMTANFAELEARVAVIEGYVKAQKARTASAREILDEAEKERAHIQKAKDLLSPIFKDIQFVGKGVAVATLPKEIPAGYTLRTKGAKRANTKV
jgi:hypothetical protein